MPNIPTESTRVFGYVQNLYDNPRKDSTLAGPRVSSLELRFYVNAGGPLPMEYHKNPGYLHKASTAKVAKMKTGNHRSRPCNSFFCFLKHLSPVINAVHGTGRRLPTNRMTQIIGLLWRSLAEEAKAPYEAASSSQKKQYEKLLRECRKAQAADGTVSLTATRGECDDEMTVPGQANVTVDDWYNQSTLPSAVASVNWQGADMFNSACGPTATSSASTSSASESAYVYTSAHNQMFGALDALSYPPPQIEHEYPAQQGHSIGFDSLCTSYKDGAVHLPDTSGPAFSGSSNFNPDAYAQANFVGCLSNQLEGLQNFQEYDAPSFSYEDISPTSLFTPALGRPFVSPDPQFLSPFPVPHISGSHHGSFSPSPASSPTSSIFSSPISSAYSTPMTDYQSFPSSSPASLTSSPAIWDHDHFHDVGNSGIADIRYPGFDYPAY